MSKDKKTAAEEIKEEKSGTAAEETKEEKTEPAPGEGGKPAEEKPEEK